MNEPLNDASKQIIDVDKHIYDLDCHTIAFDEAELWRINLRKIREKKGISIKKIAEETGLNEKSVAGIFSGKAKNPGVIPVRKIIGVLGCTINEVFAESGAVIGDKDLATLQAEVSKLTEENEYLTNSLKDTTVELATQKSKVSELEDEVKSLVAKLETSKLKLEHKEELIALKDDLISLYNYYNQRLGIEIPGVKTKNK